MLANNFYLAPGVGLQQAISNQQGFWQEVLSDPSKITDVTDEMRENFKTVITSFALVGADSDTVDQVTGQTMDGHGTEHVIVFDLLPSFFPPDQAETIEPIVDFLGSPLSGILIGALGPVLSPWVALANSINDGDGLNEILANMVGSVFNGATVDLDSLIPAISDAGILPADLTFEHLDFALGGLFSPGNVDNGPWELYDSQGDVIASVPAVGGSIFNAVGVNLTGVPSLGTLDLHANPIGPFGAWQGLSELIGLELGSNWNGKAEGPFGPKTPAFPPGSTIQYPTIPDLPTSDDVGDTAAAASQVDVSDLLNEFINDVF